MSVAAQAIRARKNARMDERYRYKNRDATASARKLRERIATEQRIRQATKKR